jgi:hypothetical protein
MSDRQSSDEVHGIWHDRTDAPGKSEEFQERIIHAPYSQGMLHPTAL